MLMVATTQTKTVATASLAAQRMRPRSGPCQRGNFSLLHPATAGQVHVPFTPSTHSQGEWPWGGIGFGPQRYNANHCLLQGLYNYKFVE